jgi:general secretion pathway protein G
MSPFGSPVFDGMSPAVPRISVSGARIAPSDPAIPHHFSPEAEMRVQKDYAGSAGFTLLELLVVMVILAMLAGYVAPQYFGQVSKSERRAARAQIAELEKALDHFRLDVGRYPTSEQGLDALVARPTNEPKWDGPYLKKSVPMDPWGRPYIYRRPGQWGEFDLLSYGKDGQPGGSGDGEDITNR